jgi:hypothetical protein
MKKRRDLVIRLVAAALSLTFVITLFPFTVFADNNSSPVTSDDLLDIDGTTPAGYSSTDTTNPYGLKAGRTVQSVAQSELLMSMSQYSNNTYTNSWQAFDTYSSGVTSSSLNARSNDLLTSLTDAKGNFTGGTKGYNFFSYRYVQCVAFDPGGSGRKNCVAYLALYGNKLYLWVVNSIDGTHSQIVEVADISYLLQDVAGFKGMFNQYTYKNFFAITAGDYDGDGKDSIVVGVPYSKADGHFYTGAIEYSYPSTGIPTQQGRIDVNQWRATPTSLQCIPCIDLATGDFNGDGTDDLAALGYCSTYNSTYIAANPVLDVYLKNDGNNLSFDGTSTNVRFGYDDIDSNNYTVYSPSVCCGDINADGRDEIIVAGYSAHNEAGTLTFMGNDELMGAFCYNIVSSAPNLMFHNMSALNAFTRDGLYLEDVIKPQLESVCAAVDGPQAAESIFIGGTLYKAVQTKNVWSLSLVYTPEYFNHSDQGADNDTLSNTFVETAIAADFDGNNYGREQIVFTVALKVSGASNYYYELGIIGGLYNDDLTHSKLSSAVHYYSNMTNTTDASTGKQSGSYDTVYMLKNAAGGETGANCNCVPCAVDNDSDGYLIKYAGKTFVYSDPKVEAILQAAPYFSGITSPGSTTYKVETDYTAAARTIPTISR